MVQINLTYVTEVTNTGTQHDLAVGVSLLDPNTGEELVMLPWWVIWNVPTGITYTVTISDITGDIPARTYQAKCRAWENYSGGVEIAPLDSVGALYQAGVGDLTGILDEAVQTLTIGAAGVSAEILNFSIAT